MAKKKKAKKKVAKKAAAKKDVLVVASKVKAHVKSKGKMMSADAIGALSDAVYAMINAAIKRTDANKRKTLKPQDI